MSAPPALQTVELPVARIHPNPWNPNRQRDIVAKAQRESMEAFGFIDPVTVRPHPADSEGNLVGEGGADKSPDDWQIVDGEHRWREAIELGLETVPCIVLDLTDAEARKLTVVLNETRGDADVALLGKLLADLQALHDDPADFAVALPYSDAEVEHLLALGREEWGNYDPAGYDPGGDDDGGGDSDERALVLSYPDDVYAQLAGWLEMIRRERGVETDAAAVLEACKALAFALNQTEAEAVAV